MHQLVTLLVGTLNRLQRGEAPEDGREVLPVGEAISYALSETELVAASSIPQIMDLLFEVQQALISAWNTSVEHQMRVDIARVVQRANTLLDNRDKSA